MKSLKSPCSSQNPMGWWPSMTMLKVWHWRSNMLSKQTWVTWLKRFVSYQDWLFSDPTWVFNIHWGSIWGCSWAAPWAPHFAYGHGQQTNRLMFDIIYMRNFAYIYLHHPASHFLTPHWLSLSLFQCTISFLKDKFDQNCTTILLNYLIKS